MGPYNRTFDFSRSGSMNTAESAAECEGEKWI